MSEAIIQFIDVHKSFLTKNGGTQKVLFGVNIDIYPGKTTVIAGGSGQGKSVILKIILGLIKPDSGQVLVEGKDVAQMGYKDLNKIRTNFGVLFQGAGLIDSLSVFENVALPLRERTKMSEEEIRKQVLETLAELDLNGHEEKFTAQLSGGMKKRVGLARALQMRPNIMLFDEPTTGLDPAKSMEIYKIFYRTQRQYGYTSIIVSHDIPKVFNLADQVVILYGGEITSFDNPEDIQWSDDPKIRAFVEMTMGHVYQSNQMEL